MRARSRQETEMLILVWLGIGALVGLAVGRLTAREYPGGRSGAASAGAMGGFLSGALIGSIVADDLGEFTASTLPIVVAGAALLTYVLGRQTHADGRSEQPRDKGPAGS
jgi:uncharacterized membrane protein YeaQ/YmgE (transglycosylase-associated protein family)